MLSLDFLDLIGLAIFGFFTGLGSTFGIEFSKYLIGRLRDSRKLLQSQLEKATKNGKSDKQADQDSNAYQDQEGQSGQIIKLHENHSNANDRG